MLHPDRIKKLLKRHGVSLSEIGRRVGVTQSCVSHVVARRRKSRKIESAIADALGFSYEYVWAKDTKESVAIAKALDLPIKKGRGLS